MSTFTDPVANSQELERTKSDAPNFTAAQLERIDDIVAKANAQAAARFAVL
jgi:hypothetical protein